MSSRCLIAVLMAMGVRLLAQTADDAELAQLGKLQSAGQHAQVIDGARRLREHIPEDGRLRAWSVEWKKPAEAVLVGERRAYIHMHVSRYTDRGEAPNLPDSRPTLNDDADRYDQTHYITCVDLNGGGKLWTRALNGTLKFIVDPRDESLWAMGKTLMHIDGTRGELIDQQNLPPDGRNLDGLILGERALMQVGQEGTFTPESVAVYDPEKRRVEKAQYLQELRFSPNRLRIIRKSVAQSPDDVTTTLSVCPPTSREAQWTFSMPGYWSNLGAWTGKDVLAISGTPSTVGMVTRLDGETGQVKWQTRLRGGAYNFFGLRNTSSLERKSWEPVGLVAGQVLAISGDGVLHWIRPDTGELNGLYSGSRGYLAFPRLVWGKLVIAGPQELFALPLEVALGVRYPAEAKALIVEASSLAATGRTKEAMRIGELLSQQAPDFAETWECVQAVGAAAGDAVVEANAGCRLMLLRGQLQSPQMRSRFGLVKVIPTGPVRAQPVVMGQFIYVGTLDGELVKVDRSTGAVVSVERFPTEIGSFTRRENVLSRYGGDRKRVEVAQVAAAGQAGSDGAGDDDELRTAPAAWNARTGYDGRTVRYRGLYYRPLHNGRVRVWDGKAVQEYASAFTSMARWQIYCGPDRPLGYGSGGVYELDEHLCPVTKLIDTGEARPDRNTPGVLEVATDGGRTLAAVVQDGTTLWLQIWSADGKSKLRDEAVTGCGEERQGRLLAVRGGYLYSAGEMIWASADRSAPAWRFAFSPRTYVWSWAEVSTWFSAPVIDGDRLWTAASTGGVYMFDLDAVCAPQRR